MPDSATLTRTRSASQTTPEALADVLRSELLGGEYAPGERFPSMREMMRRTRQTYSTVNRAVAILAAEGLLEKRPGAQGTVVSRVAPPREPETAMKRIGVVLPFWASPDHFLIHDLLLGLAQQANTDDYRIELITNTGDEAAGYEFVEKVLAHQVNGLIWMQPTPRHEVNLARLMERGVKIVLTGRRFPHLPLPVVHEDIAMTGEFVAQYMVSQRRERLVVFSGSLDDAWSVDRIDAVRKALEKRGLELPPENIVVAHALSLDSTDQGKWMLNVGTQRFLEEHSDFDAVFALHPPHLGPLAELHRSGRRRCPDDFLVMLMEVSSHRPVTNLWPDMPIALVQWPTANIGRMAVCRMEALWDETREDAAIDLSPALIDSLTHERIEIDASGTRKQ